MKVATVKFEEHKQQGYFGENLPLVSTPFIFNSKMPPKTTPKLVRGLPSFKPTTPSSPDHLHFPFSLPLSKSQHHQPPIMAAGLTAATVPKPFRYNSVSHLLPKPVTAASLFFPPIRHQSFLHYGTKVPRKTSLAVCFVVEDQTKPSSAHIENQQEEVPKDVNENQISTPRVAERLERKRKERVTYLIAAVMSSLGITSMAVMAVYYRFYWLEVPSFHSCLKSRVFLNQLSTCIGSKICVWQQGGEVPLSEMFGTFALSVGAAVSINFFRNLGNF
jgi:beta-carotene 3-hydroxylase